MDALSLIVAVASLIAAVFALVYAHTSKTVSEESRDVARDALAVAKEANVISGRAEARDTERHNVKWERTLLETGRYSLTNTGQDDAYKVYATLDLDGHREVCEKPLVQPGEALVFEFDHAAAEFDRELADREGVRQRERNRPFPPPLPSTYIHDANMRMHHFDVQVSWQTELGQHQTCDFRSIGPLGEIPD